jgi:hypothetical protein
MKNVRLKPTGEPASDNSVNYGHTFKHADLTRRKKQFLSPDKRYTQLIEEVAAWLMVGIVIFLIVRLISFMF